MFFFFAATQLTYSSIIYFVAVELVAKSSSP